MNINVSIWHYFKQRCSAEVKIRMPKQTRKSGTKHGLKECQLFGTLKFLFCKRLSEKSYYYFLEKKDKREADAIIESANPLRKG